MEYRHLKFFLAVAEELHFTRAAARLQVAQPHLSQEIRRLERELGVELFARSKRRVALTAGGQAFLRHVRLIFAATADAVRAAQRASRGETGRLGIGFVSAAAYGVLPDAIRRFRLGRPELELVLTELNSDQQFEALRSGRVDVGLLHPPREAEPGLDIETIFLEPLVVALSERHDLATSRRIRLGLLAEEPWILWPREISSLLYDETMRACAAAGFAPRIVQEATKMSTVVSLVASGLGIALVPGSAARLRFPGTVYRPLEQSGPAVPLALAWRRGDTAPALMPFLATVRDVAGRGTGERNRAVARKVRGAGGAGGPTGRGLRARGPSGARP